MIIKNTRDYFEVEQIVLLLEKGYSLTEALDLLIEISNFQNIAFIKEGLENGKNVESLFSSIFKDRLFNDLFLTLYPLKGLLYSLKETLHFLKEKNEWGKTIQKKLTYPLLLIFIMLSFSLFVHYFLLPEMDLLFSSFNFVNEIDINVIIVHCIPFLMIGLFLIILILFCLLSFALINYKYISAFLKLPFFSFIIKTYYSIKFSFYLSKLASCFDNFFDTFQYFYNTNHQTNLYPLLNEINYQLEEGVDLQTIIYNSLFFTEEFKKYFYLILTTKQSLNIIEHYYLLKIKTLEKQFKFLTNIILGLIYLSVGLYIMSLYSLIILPVLEITTLL